MNRIFFSVMLLVLVVLFSCKKDEFSEIDATKAQKEIISQQDSVERLRDSLNHLGGLIQYSVSVVPAKGSSASLKSAKAAKGVNNAVVSVSQHGKVYVDTTDESGIAVFYDLRIGVVSVNVRAENFTTVDYLAQLEPEDDEDVNLYYNTLRYAATMIPVFSLTEGLSTIKGVVTYESNLTNTTAEVAANVPVVAMIDVNYSDFWSTYFGNQVADNSGQVISAFYADLIATDTTDAQGNYSVQIPSTANGLPVKIEISDVAVNQTLLMNTVNKVAPANPLQNIRTIFSSNIGSTGPAPTTIPYVPAATVTFSNPTGAVAEQPDVPAVAQAVIASSGIVSINIVNQGYGYTQAPIIEIVDNLGIGEGAKAVAYITEGRVTSIVITEPGKGYTEGNVTVSIVQKKGNNATAKPHITYGITNYNFVNQGKGYKSQPEVLVESSTGSGAIAEAVMSGYVSKINVTNGGSNYTCAPNVIISGSNGIDAKATAVMTEFNQLHSIAITDDYTQKFETTPVVRIETSNYGSGATAIAKLKTSGSIGRIELSNAGLGYTQAPSVLINGGGGTGAVAYATLNNDGSINIEVLEEGSGYTSEPTIEISAPDAGGTQAVATAVRVFEISEIVLTNTGSGYDIVSNANGTYSNQPYVYIDNNQLNTNEVIVRPNMSITEVTIDEPGTRYTTEPTVSFTPACGFGSGASATTEILMNVESLKVIEKGSGYTSDAQITVTVVTPTDGCTEQAKYTAVLGDGSLSSVEVLTQGDNYMAPPRVQLMYGGNVISSKLQAQIVNGGVNSIQLTEPINDLNEPGTEALYTVSITTFITGASLVGNANTESGRISFVTVSNTGEGYSTTPLVRFLRKSSDSDTVTSHNFTDAEAVAVLEDGKVVRVDITNPGTGYYNKPVVEIYIPTYNEAAQGEITFTNGRITAVTIPVNKGGNGYVTPPTVTFTPAIAGVGRDAAAVAVISEGKVIRVDIVNTGTGYIAKNYPANGTNNANGIGVSFIPEGEAMQTFKVYATKTYIRDIYLGTGVRTIVD